MLEIIRIALLVGPRTAKVHCSNVRLAILAVSATEDVLAQDQARVLLFCIVPVAAIFSSLSINHLRKIYANITN